MPFPLDGKNKALYEMKRGFRLIFQAGGPAFLRSAALFPVVKCVEVYACQIDRLTKAQNQTLKIQGGSAPFFRNPTPCRTRWSTVESSSCAEPAGSRSCATKWKTTITTCLPLQPSPRKSNSEVEK